MLPILLGISMWLQQKLNPAPDRPDAEDGLRLDALDLHVHAGLVRIGLVLYWIANNTITFLQQYAIMRSHGHRPDVFGNILLELSPHGPRGSGRERQEGRQVSQGGPALAFPIAPPPEPDAAEAGRRLFAGEVTFVKGVVAMEGLPAADRPEVCFAGRSNVGKSTLINALTGRKALARASNTPGRTQEINFFALGEASYLVDLPGYGFAEAPKPVVERWQQLLKAYLAGRPSLRRAFVLIDARHGAKAVDEEIMRLLDRAAVPFQAVMTKADKVRGRALDDALGATRTALARHPAAFPEIALTSAENGEGLATLRAIVAAL